MRNDVNVLLADLDADGIEERLSITDGTLHIESTVGELLYTSPREWSVCGLAVGDIDSDGQTEIVLLLWKNGSFGPSKPFWVEDSPDRSQHIFAYRWVDKRLAPLWMSSELGTEVTSLFLDEQGVLHTLLPDKTELRWRYGSWGFRLLEDAWVRIAPEAGAGGRLCLLVVGDNIIHDSIYERAYDPATRTFSFDDIYKPVAELVRSYDLAAVTQETPFVPDPALRSSYPVFGTPTAAGDALARAGFNVILSATNHAADQGARGIRATLAHWKRTWPQVAVLGIHEAPHGHCEPTYIARNGIKLALFNCTYGLNGRKLPAESAVSVDTLAKTSSLVANVAQSASEADMAICFLHIGQEYDPKPTESQRSLVEQLVDAGASLVICSHTHVIGPCETLTTAQGNTGVVFYGLGNFMSGQTSDPAHTHGMAASIVIEKHPNASSPHKAVVTSWEPLYLECRTDGSGKTRVHWADELVRDPD